MTNETSIGVELCDVLVLGSGPAGITAAAQAKHRHLSVKILSRPSDIRGYEDQGLIEAPSKLQTTFSDSSKDLFDTYWCQELDEHNIDIIQGRDILHIFRSKSTFLISLEGGKKIMSKAIVVATEKFSFTELSSLIAPVQIASEGLRPSVSRKFESSLDGLYFVGEMVGEISLIQAMNQSIICVDSIASMLITTAQVNLNIFAEAG